MLKLLIVLSLVSFSPAFSSGKMQVKNIQSKRITLAEKEKNEVVSMLETNEKLHRSFFKYDSKKVAINSSELVKKIDSISNAEISKLLKFSKLKLKTLTEESTRQENNQSYHLVSMAFIYIVNKYDVGSKYNAYSCPMVKKKWLQNSNKLSKVHNPYAPEMPHCGTQDSNH